MQLNTQKKFFVKLIHRDAGYFLHLSNIDLTLFVLSYGIVRFSISLSVRSQVELSNAGMKQLKAKEKSLPTRS